MRNKSAVYIPLAFFLFALLNTLVPIVRDGPTPFQGGLGAAIFSFLPYLPLTAFALYLTHDARRSLPVTVTRIRGGGLVRSMPFQLLPVVGTLVCFMYFGGLTTDIALFLGLLLIVLHALYVLYAREHAKDAGGEG